MKTTLTKYHQLLGRKEQHTNSSSTLSTDMDPEIRKNCWVIGLIVGSLVAFAFPILITIPLSEIKISTSLFCSETTTGLQSSLASSTATTTRVAPTENSAAVCEGGTAHLNCLPDQIIVVKSVYYGGNYDTACPDPNFVKTNSDCSSTAAFDAVYSACNHRSSCNLLINDDLIADPCSDVSKFFMVDYNCIQVTKITDCEGNSVKLECPDGEVIDVVSVFYGRRDTTTCPKHAKKDILTCPADAIDLVSAKCNDRQTCAVHAKTDITDQCKEGSIYLEIEYLCVA